MQEIEKIAKPIASRLRSILTLRGLPSWAWENEDREVESHAYYAAKDIYEARLPEQTDREAVIDMILAMDIGSLDCPTSIKLKGSKAIAEWKADQLIPLLTPELKVLCSFRANAAWALDYLCSLPKDETLPDKAVPVLVHFADKMIERCLGKAQAQLDKGKEG